MIKPDHEDSKQGTSFEVDLVKDAPSGQKNTEQSNNLLDLFGNDAFTAPTPVVEE